MRERRRVIQFPRHMLRRCGSECDGCQICEGGLAACTRCGGAEASLPTDCPGTRLTEMQETLIMRGRLDYTWRRGWHRASDRPPWWLSGA